MIYLSCAILLAISLYLAVRIFLLHRSLREIQDCLRFILGGDDGADGQGVISTNALISVSSGDRHIRKLAAQLNRHLTTLRSKQLRYENGDRELREAITNISHDLRTPLTAISGYLELLRKELAADAAGECAQTAPLSSSGPPPSGPSSTEKSARYITVLQNRVDAMKQLTEELFRYSIVLSAQAEAPVALSLNRALEDCLMACWNSLEQRKITPVISMPAAPVMRTLDPSSLSRVFTNILNNAVKYSDGDLRVTLSENGAVTFSNHAAGLDSVSVERLFDRFYTVETASASTGLGLSIARLLTERMGGTIHAAYEGGELHLHLQFP